MFSKDPDISKQGILLVRGKHVGLTVHQKLEIISKLESGQR
jgi:hypothetical protein